MTTFIGVLECIQLYVVEAYRLDRYDNSLEPKKVSGTITL